MQSIATSARDAIATTRSALRPRPRAIAAALAAWFALSAQAFAQTPAATDPQARIERSLQRLDRATRALAGRSSQPTDQQPGQKDQPPEATRDSGPIPAQQLLEQRIADMKAAHARALVHLEAEAASLRTELEGARRDAATSQREAARWRKQAAEAAAARQEAMALAREQSVLLGECMALLESLQAAGRTKTAR